jgi:hypothetical protein
MDGLEWQIARENLFKRLFEGTPTEQQEALLTINRFETAKSLRITANFIGTMMMPLNGEDLLAQKVLSYLGRVIPKGLAKVSGRIVRFFGKSVDYTPNVWYRALNNANVAQLNSKSGLMAKNINANETPLNHVLKGSDANFSSQFISITNDRKFAENWAKRNGTEVVEIDLNKVTMPKYDLSSIDGRKLHLGDATRHDASPEIKQANKLAKGASEMLINKEIPFSAILKRYKP